MRKSIIPRPLFLWRIYQCNLRHDPPAKYIQGACIIDALGNFFRQEYNRELPDWDWHIYSGRDNINSAVVNVNNNGTYWGSYSVTISEY